MRKTAPICLAAAVLAAGSITTAIAQVIKPSTPIAIGDEVVPAKSVNLSLANVRIVSLGGTIVSTAKGRFRYQSYDSPRISIESLVDRLHPEVAEVANVSIRKASDIGSQDMTSAYLHALTLAVDATLADPAVDSVVVTTGTSVLEEVAYWLDLTLRSDKPVVVTGSMRQANTASWDGEANLFNAIRLAASQKTRCYGAVVMMDDQFYGAREVTKSDAVRLDTFNAGRTGALGYVDAGGETISGPAIAGVKGIVTAGTGGGGLSDQQNAARKAAIAKGVLFVSANRTGSGSSYGGGPGVIPAGDLLPQKARMLLQLGLATGADEATIRHWFLTIGRPDFDLSGRGHKPW